MNGSFVGIVTDTDLLIRSGFAWRFEWSATQIAGASTLLGVTIGSRGAILLDRSFATDGDDTLFELFRGTSWTGGAAWTPANRNDRFWGDTARYAHATAATGVTATPSAGNRMGAVRLHTVGPKAAQVSGDGSAIVLAPGGSYVVRITNNGTGPSDDGFALLVVQDRVSGGLFDWQV